MNSSLAPLVEELRRQVQAKADEIRADERMSELLKLQVALNQLESTLHMPTTSLVELFHFDAEGSAPNVRKTEFFGHNPLTAAKKYLHRKKENGAPFPEIVDALEIGGLELSNTEQAVLRKGLSRSTFDVAKIGEEHYTLLEFLPHIKRGGKRRRPMTFSGAQEDNTELSDERLLLEAAAESQEETPSKETHLGEDADSNKEQ